MEASTPCATCLLGDADVFRPLAECGDRSFEYCGVMRRLGRGETLYSEGDGGDEVFVALRGLLKSTKHDRLNREVIVQLIEPGASFGVESLVGLPRGTTVKAMLPTDVCAIPGDRMRNMASENADLGMSVMRSLASHVVRLEETLRDFGLKDARSRVASILLARSHHGRRDLEGRPMVTPDLTRQDLAAMAGMTPETFIRILSGYRAKGIVKTEGRRITILDHRRLASLAGHLESCAITSN